MENRLTFVLYFLLVLSVALFAMGCKILYDGSIFFGIFNIVINLLTIANIVKTLKN